MKNNLYVVSYPDYIDGKVNIVIHNMSSENKQILLPMLFDKLPADSVIAIGDNIEWANKFQNAYWFVENQTLDFVKQENQYNILGIESIVESCNKLLITINSIT